jgi:hypothetical protein
VPDPAQHLSLRINGQGDDQNDHFYASGWLNPLQAQHGIPGWQRVTLMKHFMEDYDTLDDDLWAYEGVVLPGGRTMLGRWWYATERPDAENYVIAPLFSIYPHEANFSRANTAAPSSSGLLTVRRAPIPTAKATIEVVSSVSFRTVMKSTEASSADTFRLGLLGLIHIF